MAVPRMVAACLLSSALCSLHAGELPDPTRLPAIIGAPADKGQGKNRAPALRSVILSKARRAAIIDGETVELGGRFGEAKLVEVNEGHVVLLGAQGRQVLALFPGVMIKKGAKAEPQSPADKVRAGKRDAGPATHEEKK